MKTTILCLFLFILPACSEEETPLEKFLKSETPSFYAEISGEIAVDALGKEIRLVQGENASVVSTHFLAQPGVSMSSFTSWEDLEDVDNRAITIASPVFEYNNDESVMSTFNEGVKVFDGNPSGYQFYYFKNHAQHFTAADFEGYIKNGKIEVLKYKRIPTHEPPNTGGYEEYIYVWLTIKCDLYDTGGAKVGGLNGRALCVFPAY